MSAASEVLLTRANPGLRMPLCGKYSEPPRTPTAARVLFGLGAGVAILGAASLDAASPDEIGWWWGAVALAVGTLPGILIRVSIRLLGDCADPYSTGTDTGGAVTGGQHPHLAAIPFN